MFAFGDGNRATNLLGAVLLLTCCYIFVVVLGISRLKDSWKHRGFTNVITFFILNCLASNLLRLFQLIVSVFILFGWQVWLSGRMRASDADSTFLGDDDYGTVVEEEKAATLFADMPIYPFAGAYVVLCLLLIDSLRQSRKHWLDISRFRVGKYYSPFARKNVDSNGSNA
jgi:hypothetical protein